MPYTGASVGPRYRDTRESYPRFEALRFCGWQGAPHALATVAEKWLRRYKSKLLLTLSPLSNPAIRSTARHRNVRNVRKVGNFDKVDKIRRSGTGRGL
jgi:hypothetical protein